VPGRPVKSGRASADLFPHERLVTVRAPYIHLFFERRGHRTTDRSFFVSKRDGVAGRADPGLGYKRGMDREHALKRLDAPLDASPKDIQRAYKRLGRPLKLQLLRASDVDEKEQLRAELRELVRARDVALGRPSRSDWMAQTRLGFSGRRIVELLEQTDPDGLDRAGACSFFDLAPDASADDLHAAYRVRARALVRHLANSADEASLGGAQEARARLRRIRDRALGDGRAHLGLG